MDVTSLVEGREEVSTFMATKSFATIGLSLYTHMRWSKTQKHRKTRKTVSLEKRKHKNEAQKCMATV